MEEGRQLDRGREQRLLSTCDALGPTSKRRKCLPGSSASKQLLTTYKHHVQQTKTQSAVRTLRASLLLLRNPEIWPGERTLPGRTACASLLTTESLSQERWPSVQTREPQVQLNPVGFLRASQEILTISGNSGMESLDLIFSSALFHQEQLKQLSLEILCHTKSPSSAEVTSGNTSDKVC